jgi:hypothetical protein
MDVEQREGRWHFALGPVERWIVGLGSLALVSGMGWMWQATAARLDEQGKALNTITTQQAVANAQLQQLSAQLADVPALTQQVAEMRVRVERNTQDISDLQQRGERR